MPSWKAGLVSQGVGNGTRIFEVGHGTQAPDEDDVLTCTLSEFLDIDEAEDESAQLQLREEAVRRLTFVDEQGRTPLIRAVENKDEAEVRELVRESILYAVGLNELDRNTRTALMYAAMKDQESIVSVLLDGFRESGDDVFVGDKYECSAIFYAANFSNRNPLRLLIEYARTLESSFGHVDRKGRTLLNCLSNGFDEASYRQLVDAMRLNGGNFNTVDADGKSALDWALHWNNAVFVNELLRAGADVSENQMGTVLGVMGCLGGTSPMVEAVSQGHSGVLNALILRRNADEEATMKALNTMWPEVEATDLAALMKVAAQDGCRNVLVWLAHRMTRDAVGEAGQEAREEALNTAMLEAAARGFSDLVADTIQLGAQSSAVDHAGRSASNYAVQYGSRRLFYALFPGA